MRRTVLTVDMLTEGIDFLLGPKCSARAVGHKALAVSLSDLAAMGARPEAAFVAVSLPRAGGDAIGRGLLEGISALAAEYGVTLAGGDTNAWDGPLVVSTTAIGSVPVPVNGDFEGGFAVEPEDVAAMVLFLASDAARSCTSGAFPVDGGWI